jgi:peptidoglycan lytic transglycosylase G
VASGTFFELNATLTGRRGGLRPGNYTLLRDMSYGDAIAALEKGPKVKVVPTVNVTVPEGLSIREAAPVVDKGPLKGRYAKAASERRVLRRIRRLGAPRGTRTAEGFLFPATYTLVAKSPAKDLVSKQLAAFEDNLKGIDLRYAKRKKLTRYDVLIIASMIEREIQIDRERPLAAAVIYNRLSSGMPLGIDATIRYEARNWSRPLRVSELEKDTPYNTRMHTGLPPTPIGNPGRKSLEAAANPARKDYLYYVVKPCGEGEHAWSSTDAQFARDLERYDQARAERGGKSPANC